jgi:hypothetical protein
MKRLRGTGPHNSPMNRDNIPPRPNTFHGGTNLKKGHVHDGVAPRQYGGNHGGTALPMGKLSGKRK